MRRTIFTTAILIASMGGATAQGISPNGAVFGQNWTLPQNFSSLEPTARPRSAQGSGTAAERTARAARQVQFNRNFPGTPIRTVANRAK